MEIRMMRTVCLIAITLLLLLVGQINSQEVHEVYVGEIEGHVSVDGRDCLLSNQAIVIPIHIRNSGTPECKFAPSMAFVVESPDGAEWQYTILDYYKEYRQGMLAGPPIQWSFANQFSMTFMEGFSVDGLGGDTVGFAGIVMPGDEGIYEGFDEKVLLLKIKPTEALIGRTICINNGGEAKPGYEWSWNGVGVDCETSALSPDWNGPFCFEVVDYQDHCCAYNTGGRTGNINCSLDGKRNMADIIKLISYLFLSGPPLCCPSSANVDGYGGDTIDIGDITRLIDHVYLSKSETAVCQ